ncbi:type III-B CRISPR module RAMP protein Cmr4 [Candidatus Parabeggiatoa sp. HSG14]|uniref:type III-B CRISPR module RAMP protein Cmr4 n=1 Tax=Candidatus Parabeggiatoa sp. HSG14 TaxID=3055593 RepID=UPI0025A710E1|nr:type III-B CRISPR module RAMP protein Cmr4 [Thiotrichales bacterium HSG14]
MKQAILSLLTETSLHAGTGQMMAVIDLPIQREAHTDWPCVYGSAVKGAMRVLADSKEQDWVEEVFGPEDGNTHAGSVAISDARLLLLPVRSLTGHFKWVTCPALLERLRRDYQRMGLDDSFLNQGLAQLDDAHAFVSSTQAESNLFLEEFRFKSIPIDLQDIINNISQLSSDIDESALKEQLVIVNNDIFSHLARFATPVNAHIAIDNTTKIVKPGALWYEETLPADTLLYTTVVAFNSRKEKSEKEDGNILEHILSLFSDKHAYLQIGGNETVGMGWCKVKSLQGGE